jgi:hypothetical protein
MSVFWLRIVFKKMLNFKLGEYDVLFNVSWDSLNQSNVDIPLLNKLFIPIKTFLEGDSD